MHADNIFIYHIALLYLRYAATTFKYSFDYQEQDVYWCTADIGWITGHSYIVYGPLANGATTLIYEGLPNYPDASRLWQICDKHKVNTFYTAPTALRSIMREGDDLVKKTKRDSSSASGDEPGSSVHQARAKQTQKKEKQKVIRD